MSDDFEEEPTLDQLWQRTTDENDAETRTGALTSIAGRLRAQGDFWGAIAAAQAATELFEKMGKVESVAQSHHFIGLCQTSLENYVDAVHSFGLAIDGFQSVADDSERGDSLRQLGNAYKAWGKTQEAAYAWQSAVPILVASENYTLAGIVALDIGEIQGSDDRQAEALVTFEEAFEYFKKADDLIGGGRAHDRIAAALIDLGRMSEAVQHLRDALWLFEYIKDEYRTTHAKYRLGWTLVTMFEHEEALVLLKQAVKEHKSQGRFVAAAAADLQRAHAFNAMGQTMKALNLYKQVRAVYEASGDKSSALLADVNVGENLASAGDYLGSEDVFQRVLAGAIEIEDEWLERATRVRLAEVFYARQQYDSALNVLAPTNADDWGDNLQQKSQQLNVTAAVLVALDRKSEARELVEKVIQLDPVQSLARETARAYELLSEVVSDASEAEVNQIIAQATALYLAAGYSQKATELSTRLIPKDGSPVVQMLRREREQTVNFDSPVQSDDSDEGSH